MNTTNRQIIKEKELEKTGKIYMDNFNKKYLRVLAVDFGSKYTSIFHCNYPQEKTEQDNCIGIFKNNKHTSTLVSDNYKEHISFLLNWIRRLDINYLIYEGMKDGVEKIETRQDKWMWNMWNVFNFVVSYCQKNEILGFRITPQELAHYRDNKCYTLFKWNKEIKRYFCPNEKQHQKGYSFITDYQMKEKNITPEQAREQGYEWIGEKARNELDAYCLWKLWIYWSLFAFANDNYAHINKRQKLHLTKPKCKGISNRGITKGERINSYNELDYSNLA